MRSGAHNRHLGAREQPRLSGFRSRDVIVPMVRPMRRTTSAVIERDAAELDSGAVTGTGRHRLPSRHAEAVVTTDAPRANPLTRRLAPLAVGAVVMLVATTVATLAQPSEDPSLAAQELSNTVARTDPATVEAQPTTPPPPTTPAPTTEPQAAAEPAQQPATRNPERKPAAAAPRSGGGGGDGRQAAGKLGWTRVGGDEFNGGMSPLWSPYNSEGHAGNGRRTPEALSVENGMLVIRGDSEGNTGGMSWKEDQRFGRWEMRARFPKGDDQYHPVLILWRGERRQGERRGRLRRDHERVEQGLVLPALRQRAGVRAQEHRHHPVAQLRRRVGRRTHHRLHRRREVVREHRRGDAAAGQDAPHDPARLLPGGRVAPAHRDARRLHAGLPLAPHQAPRL